MNQKTCALLSIPNEAVEYSIGSNMYDNYPKFGVVRDFESFMDLFDQVRAPKKGTFYITPAFDNDGRRCNANCKSHLYAGFDLDGGVSGTLEDDQFAEICLQMSAWRGFRYETTSSTQGNRRARFILELDRPVCREEGLKVRQFIRSLMPNYGHWDRSCDNPAQPLFMPGLDALIVRFHGQPVPVDDVLALIPPPRTNYVRRPSNLLGKDSVLDGLRSHGYLQAELSNKMHRIQCPWADEHSDGRSEAFYFEPSEKNGAAGGFHCFHGHCQHRNIGHLIHRLDCEGSKNAA